MTNTPYLSLSNISKHFPGVIALDHINLDVASGEVHCLAGQNGCGKSTLIKVISGVYQPEKGGTIAFEGQTVDQLNPREAIKRGVQVIWQDLSLFPNLSVAENIAIQQHLSGSPLVSWQTINSVAQQAIDQVGIALNLHTKVEDLDIADRQLVAICRAIASDAKLVIMDEPTASLTRQEVNGLVKVVADLKSRGLAIIFVSHRLEEVMEIADNVTVIRDGKWVGLWPAKALNDKKLAFLMTGEKFEFSQLPPYQKTAQPLLEVKNLSRKNEFSNVSLKLYPGEILGLTGLLGAGRTQLCLSLFGMTPLDSGEIVFNGATLKLNSNRDAIKHGIAYVSEDRHHQGLVMEQPIHENTIVTVFKDLCSKLGLLQHDQSRRQVAELIDKLSIKVSDPLLPVNTLSGGNAQRIAIGKWIAVNPKVLILDAPTVGVDIANKEGIYSIVRHLASEGVAILMVSDEVSEVFYNCHRIMVMKKGRIDIELDPHEYTEQQVGEIINRD